MYPDHIFVRVYEINDYIYYYKASVKRRRSMFGANFIAYFWFRIFHPRNVFDWYNLTHFKQNFWELFTHLDILNVPQSVDWMCYKVFVVIYIQRVVSRPSIRLSVVHITLCGNEKTNPTMPTRTRYRRVNSPLNMFFKTITTHCVYFE